MNNWDHSTLSLINSILAYYKVKTHHKSLDVLDNFFAKKPQNVVLLVLDGLGNQILNHFEPDGFLRHHQVDTLNAVFPPTTVAAINTLESGLSPKEHGWLGWSLYFKEFNRFIDIFPYQDSMTFEKLPLSEKDGKHLLKYKDVYTQIKTRSQTKSYVVHPQSIKKEGENFTSVYSQNFEETIKIVRELCKDEEPKYIYAYSSEPDSSLHVLGTKSIEVGNLIAEMEYVIKHYLSDLKDTLVIITADHGLIDIDEHVDISSIKELNDCLLMPCFMEPRCTSYFVKEDKKVLFKELFLQHFENDFMFFSKDEVRKNSLFGFGKEHKKWNDFVGDFISVAKGKKTIIYRNKEKPSYSFKAHHAGMTDEEMLVPLIVISN